MPVETTYTSLRERLASVLDQVANDHDVVIVRRRNAKDVALVPAEELTSLLETAHLLRFPKNAQRLLAEVRHGTAEFCNFWCHQRDKSCLYNRGFQKSGVVQTCPLETSDGSVSYTHLRAHETVLDL